jgi:hypothetical protein
MSCRDCAPESGVSITGPASKYMVLAWANLATNSRRYRSASSPRRIPAEIDEAPVKL